MTNPPNKDKQASLLKEIRQHKGITLEMVHESTKIPLDALKAIEQGYSVHKLQAFYYRGFIKIYTKFLELDETQVLQEYGLQDSAAPKPQPAVATEHKVPKPIEPSKNFVKDGIRPALEKDLLTRQLGKVVRVVIFLVVVFLFFRCVGCVVSKMRSQPKNTKISKAKDKPVVKSSVKAQTKNRTKENVSTDEKREVSSRSAVVPVNEDAVQQKSETQKSPAAEDAKLDKRSKSIELTVRATKSGWLQVKTDGQVVFQSTLKKGDAETWKAESEIELSGRNINLLEFELNGKMLGALGASDRGAKRVVFTKDGLSVKK